MLIREIFSTRTSFIRREWAKKKNHHQTSPYTGLPTDLRSNQAKKPPTKCVTMNSLLLSSCKSHITNWCYLAPFIASLQENKKNPLAKEIHSCNSILCFRAHKGAHKNCQIILHGTTLFFSPICTANTEEFPCLLLLSWDDTINFFLWWTLPT